MPDSQLAQLFRPVLRENGIDDSAYSDEYLTRIVGMVKGRINFVNDLWEQAKFFFVEPEQYAEKDIKKRWKPGTPAIMEELVGVLENLKSWESAKAEEEVLGWIASKEYHLGNVMNAFRLAVVGQCTGPHMFDITEVLPAEETIRRIRLAVERIPEPTA